MKKEIAYKRKLLFSFAVIMILMFSVSVVLAQSSGAAVGREARSVGEWFLDFFMALFFGSTEPTNPIAVVTHIFMGLILFSLIYNIVESMDFFRDNKYFQTMTAFGITLLSLIALPSDFFAVILPGYGAMGAAILTIIPFLVIFWFSIKTRSLFFAQMTWVVFAFYYVVFYASSAVNAFGPKINNPSLGYAYIGAAILGAIMIFTVPILRDMFKGSGTKETVKDIKRGSQIQKAVLKARAEEAKALAASADAAE